MSTRAQVGFYGNKNQDLNKFDCIIYVHSDGYPSSMVPSILPFIKKFLKIREYQEEYLAARLLQHLMNDYDKQMEQFTRKSPDIYEFLGFGICNRFYNDLDYYYAIYPDRLEVYHVTCNEDGELNFSKEETISF